MPEIHNAPTNIRNFLHQASHNQEDWRFPGDFLPSMLKPLTIRIAPFLDTDNKFKSLPTKAFEVGYQFAVFNAESLFTNVFLIKSVSL